jgi:parallel beta-helix repeat protein
MLLSRALAVAVVLAMLMVGFVPLCESVEGLNVSSPMDTSHSPIMIDGDADFATQATFNGWPGHGTQTDPFIISHIAIRCDANVRAIVIGNTTVFFQIANCSISPIDPQTLVWSSYSAGVQLTNVTNARLSGVAITSFMYGIFINECRNVRVDNTTVSGSMASDIRASYSSYLTLENNTITDCNSSGIALRYTHHILIQCNNVSFNDYDGFDLDFSNSDSLIRWNMASRNGWYGGGHAIYIAGTGNTIYGNIFVGPGGKDSMPAGVGYGSVNAWNSADGTGNYYGTNYNSMKGSYTSFLGTPLCSLTDKNGDGLSDAPFTIKNYASTYTGAPVVDHFPLISPTSPPQHLRATASQDRVVLNWEEPLFFTNPVGHYSIVRDDGVSIVETNVTAASFEDVIGDVENWSSINYTARWVGMYLTSGPSNVAIGQNPDRPSVRIVSELGASMVMHGHLATYSNRSLDPHSILVEWVGFDSDSPTMNYFVRLDDGAWLDNGQISNHTFTDLTEGIHSITVRAIDNDQNQAEDTRSFTVYQFVQMSVSCSPLLESGESRLLIGGKAWDPVTEEVLAGLTIGLAYSIEQGSSWAVTTTTTDHDGRFQFSIDLEQDAIMGLVLTTERTDRNDEVHYYFQNATYAAVTLQGRNGIFLTQSTSTISNLYFSSNMIKFNISAESGMGGSTSILIPKKSVDGIDDIVVTLDGVRYSFTTTSTDDYWVLTINHTQSAHEILVDIPSINFLGAVSVDASPLLALVVVGVGGSMAIGIFILKRRRNS